MMQKIFERERKSTLRSAYCELKFFTTQLPIEIIWKDLMLLFNEKISSHAIVNVQYSATKEFLFKFLLFI